MECALTNVLAKVRRQSNEAKTNIFDGEITLGKKPLQTGWMCSGVWMSMIRWNELNGAKLR